MAWFGISHRWRSLSPSLAWNEASFGFRQMSWQWTSTYKISCSCCIISEDKINWWYSRGTKNVMSAPLQKWQLQTRDGKEPKPNKNEPNQNSGFVKNWTKPEPKGKKRTRTRTKPYPVKKWTEPKPKCHGPYSVLSLNEIVGIIIHTSHSN